MTKSTIFLLLLAAMAITNGAGPIMTHANPAISACDDSAIRRMTAALQAIFPDVAFGSPDSSVCEAPGAAGVDTAGVLVFDMADLAALEFGSVDTLPEGMPVDRFDALLPDLDLSTATDEYAFAYGFDHDYNMGAYVVRRLDGSGKVAVMLADLM